MNTQSKTFIVSLGGSVLCPEVIDEPFLKEFRNFILSQIKKGYKFIIITGGGKICRNYQNAARDISQASNNDLDWLGIEVTRLNGLLLKIIFGKKAHPKLLDKRNQIRTFGHYSIIVGCGWEPGWSTDFDAVQTAVDFKVKTIVNLGKPHYVYTANPDKDKTARRIDKITWQDYLKIIPNKWTPGLSTPFDPIASRLAQQNNITVIVADGRNLVNFQKIISGEKFKGTTIQDKNLNSKIINDLGI